MNIVGGMKAEEVEDEVVEFDSVDYTSNEAEGGNVMCPPGSHVWSYDQCMVCTVCGECTGYGVKCVTRGKLNRNPGL